MQIHEILVRNPEYVGIMPSRVAASRGYFIMDPTIGNAKTVKIIVEIWSVFFLGLNFFWPLTP